MFYRFSYHLLLELHYGDKLHKPQSAREQAGEAGLFIREAEHQLNAELFLNEYPRWGIVGPHWSIILHNMFLHTTKQGQKEAERLICQGHQQSLPRLDPEADVPAIQLVGYWTSHKEIRDLYHDIYLLRRLPSSLPCRLWQRVEAIQDILSSLRSHLHRWGGTAMLQEDQWGAVMTTPWLVCQLESQSGPRRREDWHDEALQEAREAHQ